MLKQVILLVCIIASVSAHLQTGDEAARYFPGQHKLSADAPVWTYSRSAVNGVYHWGDSNPACLGARQSPINLQGAVYNKDLSELSFSWQSWTNHTLVNTGHAMQVNEATGVSTSRLSGGPLADNVYAIAQFHAHTISEHTLNGGSYPLEIHVVHSNVDATKAVPTNPAELAVVGLFFQEGEANEALDNFFEGLEYIPNKDDTTKVSIDLNALLPESREYYTYPGSLTTPGCRETVTWIVMKEVQTASGEQLEKLREVMKLEQNNRPTQPLNGRTIQTNIKPSEANNGGDGGAVPGTVNINFAGMFQGLRVN